jgi:hypothetical protein
MPIVFFAILHPGDDARTDFLIDTVIQRRLEGPSTASASSRSGACSTIPCASCSTRTACAPPGLDLGALITRLSRDNFAHAAWARSTDGGQRLLLRSRHALLQSKEEIEAVSDRQRAWRARRRRAA